MRSARTGDGTTQRLSNRKPLRVGRVPEVYSGSWQWILVATLTVLRGHNGTFASMAWIITLPYFRLLADQRSFRTIRPCSSLWAMPYLSIRPSRGHTSRTTGAGSGSLCNCPAGHCCPILESTSGAALCDAPEQLPGVCSSTLFGTPTPVTNRHSHRPIPTCSWPSTISSAHSLRRQIRCPSRFTRTSCSSASATSSRIILPIRLSVLTTWRPKRHLATLPSETLFGAELDLQSFHRFGSIGSCRAPSTSPRLRRSELQLQYRH